MSEQNRSSDQIHFLAPWAVAMAAAGWLPLDLLSFVAAGAAIFLAWMVRIDLRKEAPPRGGAWLASLAFIVGAARLLGGPGTPLWSRFITK
jgi:hypothetical protein